MLRSARDAPVDGGGDPRGVRRRARIAGPVGFKGEVLADETLREGQFVAGANRTGWHLRGVEAGRDFEARFADIRVPREGDRCPNCGGALRSRRRSRSATSSSSGPSTRSRSVRLSSTRTGRSGH